MTNSKNVDVSIDELLALELYYGRNWETKKAENPIAADGLRSKYPSKKRKAEALENDSVSDTKNSTQAATQESQFSSGKVLIFK
jgi:hypothetical protein